MELKNLILASSTSPGVQVGSQRTENGVPVFRFKKEVIRCGEFYKDADNLEFSVSRDTLHHWAAEFSRWTQNGNKVAVPETHLGAQDPTKNRGWVLDMFTEGDSLYAVMDLYGEDAPKIAATNDVSIYSLPVVVDGTGVKYSRPITHIALCTDPVIPGLSKFEAIMCSRKETFTPERKSDMDIMKLAATLGLSFGENITDAEKEVAIECALADLKKAAEEKKPKKKQKLDEDGEPMVDENDEPIMEDDEEEEKKPIAAAGKKKKIAASRTPDPLLIKLSSENRSIKLDRLVEAGKITAATRTKLAAKYVDEKALTLSLGRGGDDFDEIVLILSQNDIVELGEKSNRQTLELGDSMKKGANPLMADAKARAEKK